MKCDGKEASAPAKTILDEAIIIDGRDPTFLLHRYTKDEKEDYWPAVAASGITSICVDPAWVEDGLRDTAASFAAWYRRVRERDQILVFEVEDIQRAKREGKVGFILNMQSPTPVENEPGFVEVLYRMGLRIMQLAYQKRNLLADGCGEPCGAGLSKLGYEVIEEMNRVGMVIDLAHASEQVMKDALAKSTQPMINSHAGARALLDHPRNMSDDLLKALADQGGVFCISAYSAFLKKDGGQIGAHLEDWLKHLDYLLNLIGPDHIGFGFDVGEGRSAAEVAILHGSLKNAGAGNAPKHRYIAELTSRSNFPCLVEALIKGGYDDDVIRKVLGGNMLRLFGQVWGGKR